MQQGTGKLPCVKELIDAGSDVNAVCQCHGIGALQQAVRYQQNDCLHELFEAGADVNIKNKEGNTMLMYAVQSGNMDFVKKMISAGADVNMTNNNRETALRIAARKGDIECLKKLITARDMHKLDKCAKIARIVALEKEFRDMQNKLLADLFPEKSGVNVKDTSTLPVNDNINPLRDAAF